MARIESVHFLPHRSVVTVERVLWSPVETHAIVGLPQIFWKNGLPWREVNVWLMTQAVEREITLSTVESKAVSILQYANWLEATSTLWWDFPRRKADRCLNRYRGFLIDQRDKSILSPSTTTQRMRTTIQLYRWLNSNSLISSPWPLWIERNIGIHIQDSYGFSRTIKRISTDLAIPNRKVVGDRLEDGLLPVSASSRDKILEYVRDNASEELYLMLTLGFFCGIRVQSITDLKIQTLYNATPEPNIDGLFKIHLGPAARPPVATKFGVSGYVWIPKVLLDVLIEYSHSTRRLEREILADFNHKDNVFLTRFGNCYARRGSDKSPAINVEMFNLRKNARITGVNDLIEFKFHQSRCTFATELARLSIEAGGAIHAIGIVKNALLHKDEATTLKYIRFVEKFPIKQKISDEFTRNFLGLAELKTISRPCATSA